MENHQAILDCNKKILHIKFEDQHFYINLTEGDSEDNWGSILTEDRVLDYNFFWEENDKPYFSLYELKYVEPNIFNTDTSRPYSFEIIEKIGTYENYIK